MEFPLTPEEAQSAAQAVAAHLKAQRYAIEIDQPVADDVQFRPTITATTKEGPTLYVEPQSSPSYTTALKELVHWTAVTRAYSEVSIATPMEATVTGQLLTQLKRDGVGLLLVSGDGAVTGHLSAINPALIVTPEPTLNLRNRKAAVAKAVSDFNQGNRKGGLEEMCEIVEAVTDELLNRLAKKGWITKNEGDVKAMDWSTQIDVAAADGVYASGRKAVIDDKLKIDLHSFRGARNLVKHKTRTRREENRRQAQFADRMVMGPRLVSDVLAIKATIR